ncbi:MAG: hypothetical protein GY806_10185 [Gammaproteobacteria bacterium]|nr:hypothetical protein [Gammaproteobacteria bacterium]
MDASALRWVLAIIGIVLLVGIYLYGLQQNRMRKRAARETFTREEIDTAFIEDSQLKVELDNLGEIISADSEQVNMNDIKINPALEADIGPVKKQTAEVYIADTVVEIEPKKLISHLLIRADYGLLTGEEVQSALTYVGLVLGPTGMLEFHEGDQLCFSIANLSQPGHFSDLESEEFTTLGLNCFINLESNDNAFKNYEKMLKKIDELVRLLNFKVYQSNQQLLTISEVTDIRKNLLN